MTWVQDGIFAGGGEALPEGWADFAAQTGITAILHLRADAPAVFRGPSPASFLWLAIAAEDQAGLPDRLLAGALVAGRPGGGPGGPVPASGGRPHPAAGAPKSDSPRRVMSINDISLGIAPTAGRRPATLAALDDDLRIVHLGPLDADGVVAFVEAHPGAVVAVDAPQSPNRGLMRRPDVRRRFGLPPRGHTFGQWRLCEYELRRRHLRIYSTPSEASAAPSWMRAGFALYKRLTQLGFGFFQQGNPTPAKTMVEGHPHACFAVLLGPPPLLT